MRRSVLALASAAAVLLCVTVWAQQQGAAEPQAGKTGQASATMQDIEKTLGSVPVFFESYPEAAIPGAWEAFKAVQLNPDAAIPGKYRELIGLAVAAQIPCDYCVYFHTNAAKAMGATEAEVEEAVAMAAMTRHWSTVLNGTMPDKQAFRKQVDQILEHVSKQAAAPAAPAPPAAGGSNR